MGLFGWRRKAGVRGTARVVSTSAAPHGATHGTLRMTLVVEAPGIPAYSCTVSKIARVDKWPSAGDVLPVEVDPDSQKIDVLWDELPTHADVAREHAERLAAHLRQQPGAAMPGGAMPADPNVAGMVEQLQQMFPGAVVNVGAPTDPISPPPAGPVNVVASQSDADPVERLEKLARLRDAGIVDETQFQQLKAQILDQALDDDT
jgi:hypothetical protein